MNQGETRKKDLGPSNSWRENLAAAARDSKLPLQFTDDVKKEDVARTLIAILRGFGQTSGGFVAVETMVPKSTRRPPDILLAHPSVGVCVLECKSWSLKGIQGIEKSRIMVMEGGRTKSHHVFDQASAAMFQIKDATRRVVQRTLRQDSDEHLPFFSYFIVFPNIPRAEWCGRQYDQCLNMAQILFADEIEAPASFRGVLEKHTRSECKRGKPLTPDQLDYVCKAIGDSAVVNDSRTPRADVSESKLGFDIDEIALSEKNLSLEQQEISRADFEGHPQLIRGVAGSGKSIVLANNVANSLVRRMDLPQELQLFSAKDKPAFPRIGVVCFNRSLVSFLKEKIRIAFEERRFETLPEKAITCNYMNGFMYRISTDTGLLQYQHVREDDPRSGATVAVNYLNQLRMLEQSRPDAYESLLFDCIYVDEGQDFHPEEFQLLMKLLKPHPKTGEGSIVIFYDDAQNLYGRPRPTWSQIGIDITGRGRSRVMKECFRNTREVVEFAFNVLLGTKADTAVRVQTREFADVAYLKENGLVEEHTDRWKVNFTERSQNLLPEVRLFESRQQEMEWIASKIAWLINDRQVRSEDVLVLFEQANEFVGLEQMIISKVPSLAGFVRPFGREKKNVDKDSYILQPGKLTLSTTKGAKGYDAYVVFLIGADQFPNTREGRASFYVGATRGKLALYVSGRNSPGSLLNEAAGVHQMLFLPNY